MSQDKIKEVEIVTQRRDDISAPKGQQIEETNQQKHDVKVQDLNNQQSKKNGSNEENLTQRQANQEAGQAQQQDLGTGQGVQKTEDAQEEQLDVFNVEEKKIVKFPQILAFLENTYFQIFITLLTFYALFGSDVKILASDKSADLGFDAISIICLIMFSVEIILAVIARDDYLWSFFFWLDIISTVSLILDIQIFAIFGSGSSGTSQSKSLAKAGQASRVGTKAGRVVRIVRLIRIVKLYKAASEGDSTEKLNQLIKNRKNKRIHPRKTTLIQQPLEVKPEQQDEHQINNNNAQSPQDQTIINNLPPDSISKSLTTQNEEKKIPPPIVDKQSRVSKKLSDLSTKRVIIIVLLLLFIMPLFSADYFFDPPASIDYAMKSLQTLSESTTTAADIQMMVDTIITTHSKVLVPMSPIVFLQTPFLFVPIYNDSSFSTLRNDEQDAASYDLNSDIFVANHPGNSYTLINEQVRQLNSDNNSFVAVLNKRAYNIVDAGLSIGRTLFVCVVLTLAAIMFTSDANQLALGPIERMIEKVNAIARNPISAKEQKLVKDSGEGEEGEQYETVIIENAIVKIGFLLALGFGDAGSEIIGSNMAKGGDVDPMIPGKKKCAIYGFCDIRNFTDSTEQLQEDVMVFVNNIGEVVHSMVDRFAGAANKNIGDAFLLVWKINEKKYTIDESDNTISYKDMEYMRILADFSIISFMKIWAKLNRETKCLAYRTDERLLKRMPGYKVKMGFGLHIGWGIEGAIGSEFKIDASYLSPNVNMAGNLEASTKAFGIPLLISGDLRDLFTPKMQKYVRYIDQVVMAGPKPIRLYTVDMIVDKIPASKDPVTYEQEGLTKNDRYQIEKLKKSDVMIMLTNPKEYPWDAEEFIQRNKDLRLIMEGWNEKFQNIFAEGFQFYLSGDWQGAKKKFQEGFQICPEDGPTTNLMHVMEEHHFQAPKDWQGYRNFEAGH